MFRTILKVAGATLAFAVLHSVCASPPVKNAVRKSVGARNYRGWYRAFYTVQSILSLGALIVYICSLPNRTLYRAKGRLAWLMRAGQILALSAQVHSAFQVGIGRLSGADNLWAWLRGKRHLRPAAEGQGPSMDVSATGRKTLRVTGMFRNTRHPLNFFALPLLWLQTPMTVRWASFSTIGSIYFYIGSIFEALRLRGHYGRQYQNYDDSSVPFFFPRLRRSGRTAKHSDASDAPE